MLSLEEELQMVEFLEKTAPEQVPFVIGDYFKHGLNIAFGYIEKKELKACIRYCIQPIGYEQKTAPLTYKGKVLTEAKINAFAVENDCRNKGIGKNLQKTLIEDAKQRGCYQLSSYSTFDKEANYAVKIALNFCIQPEIQPDGTQGSYFLMKL